MKNGGVVMEIEVLDETIDFPYLGDVYPEEVKNEPEREVKIKRQTSNIAVKKLWKGSIEKTAIFSSVFYWNCAIGLSVGETYLFYGWQNGDLVKTSYCNRTKSAKSTEVEMEMLNLFTKGVPLEKIHGYLIDVLDSKRGTRIRKQAASLLLEEWYFYHKIAKDLKYEKEARIPKEFSRYIPKGWNPGSFPTLANRAWEIVSRDPDPEIRKQSIQFMNHLDLPKEEVDRRLHIYLKDDSARVRHSAIRILKNYTLTGKEQKETLSLLQSVLENEYKTPPSANPKERKAQSEIIQGILWFMIRNSKKEEASPWMFPYILKDLTSEFSEVKNLASYNLRTYRTLNDEQREKVLSLYKMELKKLNASSPADGHQGGTDDKKWDRNNSKKRITLYLIKHGTEEDQKNLLQGIIKDLKNDDSTASFRAFEMLREFHRIDDEQKQVIRSVLYSKIKKESSLSQSYPEGWRIKRNKIQGMISYLINQINAEDVKKFVPKSLEDFSIIQKFTSNLIRERKYEAVKPVLPEILQDFKEELPAAQHQAYLNLEMLKPLDDNLLKQLERIHQNADSRDKPRVRQLIDYLMMK
jgi:hypothetical protein